MVEPIVLKTVRPFIMDDIDLDDELEAANLTIDDKLAVGKLLKTKIQELIGRIDEEWEIKHADTPTERRPEKMLPLIRLRVQYTRHEMGNLVRFGQDFVGKVANPKDLLQFAKKKTIAKKKGKYYGLYIRTSHRILTLSLTLVRQKSEGRRVCRADRRYGSL